MTALAASQASIFRATAAAPQHGLAGRNPFGGAMSAPSLEEGKLLRAIDSC
jgi:hypothetical protein